MKIHRHFTKPNIDPLDEVRWDRRESVIREPDGTVVFEMRDIEVPSEWSQVATDILAQKYFRKAGVPRPDGSLGRETSARQVVRRLAGCWTDWGRRYHYFDTDADAAAFDAEISYMLIHQMAAPNSPQWFNTGLAYAYGINGPSQGHYYIDPDTKELVRAKDAYSHPQPHACLPYHAAITTPDGPIPIGDIVTKGLVGLRVYDVSGTTRVVAVKSNGIKPVFRITLANGNSIEATADHLVLTCDSHKGTPKWKAVSELRPGTRLIQRSDTTIEAANTNMQAAEAALAGWLQADGFVGQYEFGTNRSLTIEAMTINDDERAFVNQLVENVFPGVHRHERSVDAQSQTLTIRRTRLYGERLRPFVQRYGLLKRNVDLEVPPVVLGSGVDAVCAYLRALFQADGCVRLRKDRNTGDIVFGTTSPKLARQVSALLLNLGIYNRISRFKDARSDRRDYHHVTIAWKSAKEAFAHRIGFVSSDKQAKLESVMALQGRSVAKLRDEMIERIEEIGSMEVFDIETESHNFLTNNIVVHNCFIQSVEDDLVNESGIMDLWVREARLFKYGSGTGTNFSNVRAEGERLSGGGSSSGLMSFLRVGDRAAGAIKSGGTTRRAAKMVILDIDHPDIEKFINWKVEEEKKVAALIAAGYNGSYEGDAYQTVSGQNSNNSVRIPDKFIQAVRNDGPWDLLWRRDKSAARTVRARDLWDQIGRAAWACADPGIQYDDIINSWHTCPQGGRIRASNPCSEYMFLDDTACNLASINLIKFYDAQKNQFDVAAFQHACRLWTIVLEISVLMAQFPSPEIARRSYEYRTLGLGYANLGTLLMVSGIPYDSPRALAIAGALSSILTGESYAASAEMAGELGPFPRYKENAGDMLRVMRNHRRVAYNAPATEYEQLSVIPMGIDAHLCPAYLLSAARQSWDRAVELGQKSGYRNAQATCIAPTGCLVGNSLVLTDRGLMRLGRLGNADGAKWQDIDLRVLTDDGEQQATKFFVNGVANTRRITTASGYAIQGTPEHRIKVLDGTSRDLVWKRFADIQPDDIVALSMNNLAGSPRVVNLPPLGEEYWTSDYTTRVPRTMCSELAELLGYFMGDGSLHSRGLRFCVGPQDADVADRICELGHRLFNIKARQTQEQGYTAVAFHSVQLTQWWEACGFSKLRPTPDHSGKGYAPRIPDALLASNDPHIYSSFVRGLFEADGCVTNGVPTWSTAAGDFASEVKTLLLALGFPTTTKHDVSGRGQSRLHVIRLLNVSYGKKFFDTIGFIGSRKRSLVATSTAPSQSWRNDHVFVSGELLEELTPLGSRHRNAAALSMRREGALSRRMSEMLLESTRNAELKCALDFFYDRVALNEDGGEQFTFDLSVPANVTYFANGFISHNTIGLQMDCDTTGIEPDFALVKFKKLAGGGYFKIINQSIPVALTNLGYTDKQIDDIVRYAKGSGSLYGAPYINAETLRARGFTNEDIIQVEKALPTVFDIGFAFNQWTLGEPTLQRLGVTPDEYGRENFDLLAHLGYTRNEIEAANNFICGTMTIEGSPHLKEEHYPVFDCANKCGKLGKRFIHHMGHVRMMAAAQPSISGALSKTINMPNEATVDDIKEAYLRSWDLGLKSIALYRDGSKLSQPLSNKATDKTSVDSDRQLALSEEFAKQLEEARRQRAEELRPDEILAAAQRILANATNTDFKRKVAQALERNRLPAKRRGWTQKAKISGHTVFLRTGEYADGTLGEIFVDLHKEGASFRSLMSCFAIAVSIGLQYGVPLEEFVDKFVFTRFEPNGFVDHPNIKHCTSVVDYIFRVLGMEYLGRTDFVQVKPEDKDVDDNQPEDHAQAEFEARVSAQQAADEPAAQRPAALWTRPHVAATPKATVDPTLATQLNAMRSREAHMASLMGDAPLCDVCGSITRRNGACYVCDGCGRSMGCS